MKKSNSCFKLFSSFRADIRRLFLTMLLLLCANAWAGPWEDAVAAYGRKDYTTALKIFRSMAAQGDAAAQFNLGLLYDDGQGAIQDYAEAVKWFRLAAAQGNAKAQFNLGQMYYGGQGVVQDRAETVKWYRLAAAQGMDMAQYNLGLAYFKGEGVFQDYIRAHSWLNLSAVKGGADAVRVRNLVAEKMTPQQIGEAQKLARECQAQNFRGCN